MMKAGLLGSCVSREPLACLQGQIAIAWYQARTCIPSMASPPVYVPHAFPSGRLAPFEQRNVAHDIAKSWLANIRRADYDFLLLDFIDERFGCSRYKDSLITYSTSLRAAEIAEDVQKEMKWVNPYSAEYMELIDKHIGFVLNEISQLTIPVVCNNVYWKAVREDGTIDPKCAEELCGKMNEVLASVYDRVRAVPNVTMIDVPNDEVVVSVNHKWGAAPFHYTDKTNQAIAAGLLAAVGMSQGGSGRGSTSPRPAEAMVLAER
jgi:hypothetical protein